PQGERSRKVLDQNADESFHRAERRPMDHHRTVRTIVWANVLQLKPLRQVEIQLDGAKLPLSANTIAHDEIDFRTIKGSLTLLRRILHPQVLDDLHEDALGHIPILLCADIFAAA